jgi:hypothetical protein
MEQAFCGLNFKPTLACTAPTPLLKPVVMATIHVNRGATSLGAFPEEEVREGLRTGRFVSTDLGWREGMPSWKPLSDFPDLISVASPGAAAPEAPPPQTPSAIAPVAVSTTETPAARTGLPWEHRQELGFVNAFVQTLSMVLTKPDLAFRTMRTDGGLAEPLIYALIGGCAGAIVAFLFSFIFQSMGLFTGQRNVFGMMPGVGIGAIGFIILIPIFVVIGLFIGSAIIHLCLMLVGGANKTFETTFRVLTFTQGSTGPLQMIPICGGMIAGIWALVANCIGLARAHETSTGRAVLAVLLPLIVCCGGAILFAVMFGALGAWKSQH